MAMYWCPNCGFSVPLEADELPYTCVCHTNYISLESLSAVPVKRKKVSGIPVSVPTTGPGTELTALLKEYRIRPNASCGCDAKATQMNVWGIAGCKANRIIILGWMQDAYDSASIAEWVQAGAIALGRGKPKTLAGILDEAIERAATKLQVRWEDVAGDLRSTKPRDVNWRQRPDVIAAQQTLLDMVIASKSSMPDGFAGRGIVVLGGTAKYFGAAYVLVTVLRKIGCELPIEWWYLGWHEMDQRMVALAEEVPGVRCVNLLEHYTPRRSGGWEAKPWVIMHSRFKEVLFIDADNIPTMDPTYLFDIPEFLEKGTVAWPDHPPMGWSITPTAFQVARLPVPGNTKLPKWKLPTDYTPWETGQLMVDKSRAWHALELWSAMSDQSDFWYPFEFKGRGNWYVYGDKDLAYLAWEATKTPYAIPGDMCAFAGDNKAGAFMQRDFSGRVIFQHRVQPANKWRLHGENRQVPGTVNHDLCLEALEDLRTKWTGQVWDAWDETKEDKALAAEVAGDMILFRDGSGERLTLFPGGRTSHQHYHWTMRYLPDPRILLSTFDRRAVQLGRDANNSWVWCNHDTQDFLMVAPPSDFDLPLRVDEAVVWHEVVTENEYRLPDSFGRGDTIIDVGGHCGMFAYACLQRGVGKVVSIEPIPENFARLKSNMQKFGRRSVCIQAAAWRSDGQTPDTLFLEQKPGAIHTGGWSAIGTTEGFVAKVIRFDQVLDLHGPAKLVKLDCEGSEWPILESFTRWDMVEAWCGEYHHATADEAKERLLKIFKPRFYKVVVEPNARETMLGHFWVSRTSKTSKRAK